MKLTCDDNFCICGDYIITSSLSTMPNPRVFDIRGRSLKLESAEDVSPLLEGHDPTIIEEIYLGGNTIGVDASKAFAAFIDKTQALRVPFPFIFALNPADDVSSRSPIYPTFLSDDSSLRSHSLSKHSARLSSPNPHSSRSI